ncbi:MULTISPECIES: MarR family winged helix-turn-helix transcriptional regulator [Gordonia]|uniref:Putative MarR family transcriptional regulator n=1 Tax=Gordonia alkanivorans NBRC 16433 TaxID=1027371 RepID=F9VPL2_9ACTN|nr:MULTISPECIES: MarR family transcriptional regulator [Gordonia]MDH3008438.1 MarR family transcriptional regulator [Gordonia alkanivorans]MDH3015632.1 MarR family transcriptional regulator [Gordonia alkanivorans]MDH3020366.1 MarR family transcriptional regulator [Gordonia alkanivorans]MDH3026648.1 MarR family transcriptional regulator [Gordonia alkanivorans]MDH3040220.1 MarR family transcriptional regulator [Gordonia alkanivorans]
MTSTQKTPDTITDPVDWARHYWEQQKLDGDEQRFLTLTSLLRYQRIVADEVETELKKHGLNMTDYLLLMTLQLSEHGTRLISSLARNLMVHATTATLATDRLEARKLLERSPHPTDRRATCVTITPQGRKIVAAATRGLTGVDFGMTGSTPKDVKRLRDALTAMRQGAGDA